MRLFRRKESEGEQPSTQVDAADAHVVDSSADVVEEITAGPLGEAERDRVAAALAALAARDIDVDDLASLSAAFDAAVDQDDHAIIADLAIGVGEFLDRHGTMRWAMVHDSFGTDLGLEGRRRDLHVVPDSLLAARWMRREKGWLIDAVGHLADINRR